VTRWAGAAAVVQAFFPGEEGGPAVAGVLAGRWDTTGTLEVEVRVGNTGDRAGTDIVQLYVRDRYASVTRPIRQLIGLGPGAARARGRRDRPAGGGPAAGDRRGRRPGGRAMTAAVEC